MKKMYTKPVYYTSKHKISLPCKCTQGLDSDINCNINDKRNVQGQNISKERWMEH